MRTYTAADILVLTMRDAVRQRPDMYVGSTDSRGLQALIDILLDNTVEQFRTGNAKRLDVSLNRDGSLTCEDDGEGIVCKVIETIDNRPFIEAILVGYGRGLSAELRFGNRGMCSLGLVVVNAMSESFVVTTNWDGIEWRVGCKSGLITEPLTQCETATTGKLKITFKPDPSIFGAYGFDERLLCERLRELSFLVPGLRITFHHAATSTHREFFSSTGAADYVKLLTSISSESVPESLRIEGSTEGLNLEAAVAVSRNSALVGQVLSFVNTYRTERGGSHENGFLNALRFTLNAARKRRLSATSQPVTVDACRRRMVAVVSAELPGAMYEGADRSRLADPAAYSAVYSITKRRLLELLKQSPATLDCFLNHLQPK